jgi:hypothetical protein
MIGKTVSVRAGLPPRACATRVRMRYAVGGLFLFIWSTCAAHASQAQGADPYVGIATIGNGTNQMLITRSGNTYVSYYTWPTYVQAVWVSGPNLFDVAGGSTSRIVADVCNDVVLTTDGTLIGAQSREVWGTIESIAERSGIPSVGPFVALWLDDGFGGPIPYSATAGGQVFRRNRYVDGAPWELVRVGDMPTIDAAPSWGGVKARYR